VKVSSIAIGINDSLIKTLFDIFFHMIQSCHIFKIGYILSLFFLVEYDGRNILHASPELVVTIFPN
jgi:hypothetical protein